MRGIEREHVIFVLSLGLAILIIAGGGEGTVDETVPATRVKNRPEIAGVTGRVLEDAVVSWSPSGRNIFEAPREEKPAPPISVPAPERPRLPWAGPVTVPGPDIHHLDGLRHVFVPESFALPDPEPETEPEEPEAAGGDEVTPPAPAPAGGDATGPPVDRAGSGVGAGLRRSREEQLRREREAQKALQSLIERRRRLDKIVYRTGAEVYGLIVNRDEEKYRMKLELDRLVAALPSAQNPAQIQQQLRQIRIRFREDRNGVLGAEVELAGDNNIQTIVFADTPKNRYHLERVAARPDDVTAQMALADILEGAPEKENDLLAAHYGGMIRNGLTEERVFLRLVDVCRRSLRYDDEARTLEDAIRLHPESAELHFARGDLLRRLRVPEAAEPSLRLSLEKEPGLYRARVALGRLLVADGRGAEAVTVLDTARASATPGEKRLSGLVLGRARLLAGDLDGARREFDQVGAASGRPDSEALSGLGAVACARGDFKEAEERFAAAVEADPLSGAAIYNLAVARLRLGGKWIEARTGLDEAAMLDPFIAARARAALGYLHERRGDDTAALQAYESALEADPTDPWILHLRGRGLLNRRAFDRAFEVLSEALRRLPDQIDILSALGEAALSLGRFEEARRFLDRALRIAPGQAPLLARLGLVHTAEGRMDAAFEAFDAARKAAPGDVFVDTAFAYYYYRKGAAEGSVVNQEEALGKLKSVIDRTKGSNHPLGAWAAEWHSRISENLRKVIWEDGFSRMDPQGNIQRRWIVELRAADPAKRVDVSLQDGHVRFLGRQGKSGVPTTLTQRRDGRSFVSFEAAVTVPPGAEVHAGIAIIGMRRKTTVEVNHGFDDPAAGEVGERGILLGRTPAGQLAFAVFDKGNLGEWTPVAGMRWPENGTLRLGIAVGDRGAGRFRLWAGNPETAIGPDLERTDLRSFARDLYLTVFTMAEIDKPVDVTVDDVRIVTMRPEK